MRATLIAAVFCASALVACGQAQTDTAAPAPAAAPYVGEWAADLAACQIPQEQEGAPHVFTSDGYDQHEAHCTFANVAETGPNAWRIAAACQVEGDEASLGWDVTVDGDTMMLDSTRLIRCP